MWTFWDHKRLWSKKSTPRVLGSFPLSAIFKKWDRGECSVHILRGPWITTGQYFCYNAPLCSAVDFKCNSHHAFEIFSAQQHSIVVATKCGVALHFQLNLMQTPVLELHYVTSIFLYLVLFADNSISFLYHFSGKTKQPVKTSTLSKIYVWNWNLQIYFYEKFQGNFR